MRRIALRARPSGPLDRPVRERRSVMRRADRDERADSRCEAELRERVASVEATEAVRDDVDLVVTERFDLLDESLRAIGNRGRARQPHGVGVAAERLEVLDDPAEVMDTQAGQAGPIEAEQAMNEHDRKRFAGPGAAGYELDALERASFVAGRRMTSATVASTATSATISSAAARSTQRSPAHYRGSASLSRHDVRCRWISGRMCATSFDLDVSSRYARQARSCRQPRCEEVASPRRFRRRAMLVPSWQDARHVGVAAPGRSMSLTAQRDRRRSRRSVRTGARNQRRELRQAVAGIVRSFVASGINDVMPHAKCRRAVRSHASHAEPISRIVHAQPCEVTTTRDESRVGKPCRDFYSRNGPRPSRSGSTCWSSARPSTSSRFSRTA